MQLCCESKKRILGPPKNQNSLVFGFIRKRLMKVSVLSVCTCVRKVGLPSDSTVLHIL